MPHSKALYEFESHDDGAAARVVVRGELDLSQVDALTSDLVRVIDATASPQVVLDLTAVDYLDSSGLRVLVQARAHAARARRELTVGSASEAVTRVLEVTNLREALGPPLD